MKSTDAFRFTYTRICLWYMSRIVDKCTNAHICGTHLTNIEYRGCVHDLGCRPMDIGKRNWKTESERWNGGGWITVYIFVFTYMFIYL